MTAVHGRKTVITFFLLITLYGTSWAAPEVDLGSGVARPGEQVAIPVYLTNETGIEIAALSTDIAYDSVYLTPVDATIGPAGQAVDKEVMKNIVEPGIYRIGVLSTANLNPIVDGLVVTIIFSVNAAAPEGTYMLGNSPACSNRQGAAVSATGSAGFIEVTSSTTTSEPDDGPNSTTIPPGSSTSSTPASSTTTVNTSSTTTVPATTTILTATTSVVSSDCALNITPAAMTITPNQSISFTTALSSDVCSVPQLRWSVESSIGSSIDENGIYRAGANNADTDASDTVLVVDYANGIGARALIRISGGPAGSISRITPETITSSPWRKRLHLLFIHSEQRILTMSSRLSFKPSGDIQVLATLATGNIMIALIAVQPNTQGSYDVTVATGEDTYTKQDALLINPLFFAMDHRAP
jgi:hypothetical protein